MNLARTAHVGHSSSGGYIGEQLANGTAPFEAAVLLQPVVHNEGPATFSKKMPILLVQGQCDWPSLPRFGRSLR